MSSSNHNEYFRSWMDRNHQDPSTGLLTEEFVQGLQQFMSFASNQQITMETGKMYCPCPVCKNRRFGTVSGVWKHLYSRGFMAGYKIWYSHGETDLMVNFGSTSEENNLRGVGEQQGGLDEHIGTVQMVEDRFRMEEPNFEAQKFYDMLDAAKNPLYDGCREGISPLSAATRMMSIKTDYNLSEDCVDAIADFVKGILPEDNFSPMYCTRGYAFKIFRENNTQSTRNDGISARSGEIIYYGILREILEIHFPGILNLRCVALFADWYNPIAGYGVRIDEFGVTSVHSRRRLPNYDPFILASQADQVTYIRYPRVRNKQDPWIAVIPIIPRGKVDEVSDSVAMQQSSSNFIGDIHVDNGHEIDLVVDFTGVGENEVFSDSESDIGEYHDDFDSTSAEDLSDSE